MNKMSTKTKAAYGCYLMFMIIYGLVGITYASASEIMSYHQQVTGAVWSDLDDGVQTMLLGFLRLWGVAQFYFALSVGILLFVPFRRGERWARWATPALCLVAAVPTAATTIYLASETGAATPRAGALSLVVFALLGFALSGDVGRAEQSSKTT